ncbi:MAG: low specificity L-threonine aldolase [Actinomycetia bacterium]|nr:low specificity L-threonine aldolase [Actinomycetes bacterium]
MGATLSPTVQEPPLIDLRSDTVTQPDERMRAAMAEAPVGDDVFGEDPSVLALEAHVAELLGQDAGLFCPTGSMANQIGMRLLVEPGQEILTDQRAHVVRAELGAAGAYAGITTRTWTSADGIIYPQGILNMATPDAGPYMVSTVAIAVENTHNFAGGRVQPLPLLRKLSQQARPTLKLHLDGARLWNAHVATGVPLADYGNLFDTVSVCLSKGLGAPIGSVLVSSQGRIGAARVLRKRLGGGMRQVGILAAAGQLALTNINRLSQDHQHAALIAGRVAAVSDAVTASDVETNIVTFDLSGGPGDAASFASRLRNQGVGVSVLGKQEARIVTHLGISTADAEQAGELIARELQAGGW